MLVAPPLLYPLSLPVWSLWTIIPDSALDQLNYPPPSVPI